MAVGDIHIEGTFFQNFIKNELGAILKTLNSNVLNINVKFQAYVLHSKRDIYVQKIKVKKLMFRYIPPSLKEMTRHLYDLHIIRKVSYSG